ncbi:FecR family protein [uncultured Parabacteroides sp.]|uniref:FecR family protein n=1 Tax=uncultured Parabacteroides sp. TaxID=512312 RepID=UPI00262C273C|nr:FecR family protein [uncultured Parabacteroides sp.]
MNDIILKYLQGNASEKEKDVLLGWLRAGEENKKVFSEIRDRWLESGAAPVSDPEWVKRAFGRFMAGIEAKERVRKQIRLSYFVKVAASVALLLACSLGGYFAGQNRFFDSSTQEQLVMNRVIMGKDSKGPVSLPDGTTVWLNANSRLIYPERFSEDKRFVKLEGEGYFEVVRNEKAPFFVETDGMVVNVLGTHFNVNNYENKETIETTLLSGKVEVLLSGMSKGIILKPNQRISCNRQNGTYSLAEVDASDYIIWIGDRLVCTNEKLSTILHRMKHWYNMDIECRKGVPLDHRLSLTIRKESPEEILKLLTLISPIRYTIKGDKIIISPK